MNNISLRLGRTRSCFFSKTVKMKLEAGIDILNKVLQNPYFEEKILQYQWKNEENRRFFRFYHASGLSNKQVLDRLQNYDSYFEDLGSKHEIVILPFNSRKEIQAYQASNNPIVWISMNCLNNNWYTPVHVASAIGHELALLIGLDSSTDGLTNPSYDRHKVPNYMGQLMMETAEQWKHKIKDIGDSFDQINKEVYNYFPTSTVIGELNKNAVHHHQTNFDHLISSLLIEQEALFALQDTLSLSETNRLICIEEVLLKLNKLKTKLVESSLDGSEMDFHPLTEIVAKRGSY